MLKYWLPLGTMLSDREKIAFDDMKQAAKQCVNEYLVDPDIQANERFIDMFFAELSPSVQEETVRYLIRQLQKESRHILLTLNLVNQLLERGGRYNYATILTEEMTAALQQVAEKYVNQPGLLNIEITESCLNLIQRCGESFKDLRNFFPHVARVYYDLKMRNFPFMDPYDRSQNLPIGDLMDTHPATAINGMMTPAMVNQTMATNSTRGRSQSLATPSRVDRQPSSDLPRNVPSLNSPSGASKPPSLASFSKSQESAVLEVCYHSKLLRDSMIAAADVNELKRNELISGLLTAIANRRKELLAMIDETINCGQTEMAEQLMLVNDNAAERVQMIQDIFEKRMSLIAAQEILAAQPSVHPDLCPDYSPTVVPTTAVYSHPGDSAPIVAATVLASAERDNQSSPPQIPSVTIVNASVAENGEDRLQALQQQILRDYDLKHSVAGGQTRVTSAISSINSPNGIEFRQLSWNETAPTVKYQSSDVAGQFTSNDETRSGPPPFRTKTWGSPGFRDHLLSDNLTQDSPRRKSFDDVFESPRRDVPNMTPFEQQNGANGVRRKSFEDPMKIRRCGAYIFHGPESPRK